MLNASSTYVATGGASPAQAFADIKNGLKYSHLWRELSWQDIRLRYRGSILGPFWLTLSTSIMIMALGFVYSHIFKLPMAEYFPFLALGLLLWNFISTSLIDSCTVFTQAEHFIKQIRLPFSVYVYRTLFRNLLIFAHNVVIYIVIALVFGVWPGEQLLILPIAMLLLILNATWVMFLLGIICARFRDITQIITSFCQILFFVTPIVWRPELLAERAWVVQFNPFAHFINLVRLPLLGQPVPSLTWLVCGGCFVGGWLIAFYFFQRFRARLAYWV